MDPNERSRPFGKDGSPANNTNNQDQNTPGRVEFLSEPPAAPEAEKVFLGSLMELKASERTTALTDTDSDHFSTEANRITYEAIKRLHDRSEAADPMSVLCELQRAGVVSSWPTPAASVGNYLHDLVASVTIPLGYAVARRAVIEAAARRRVHRSAIRLAQAAGAASFDGLNRLVACETSSVTEAMRAAVSA